MPVESEGLLLERAGVGKGRSYAWFWRDILVPLLLTRLFFTAVGFFCINTMPLSPYERVSWTSVRHAWLNTWFRWDSIWYLRIVRDGYFYTPGQMSSVAFSPLYPGMMKAGGYLLGGSDLGFILSGVILANVILVIALAYFWKLVRLDFDEGTARRAVFYALVTPMTIFFSAAYPMSLILAILVASFYYARKQQWWAAGCVAALAPLARPDGILLVPGLLFEYLRQRSFRWRMIRADVAPTLVLPAMALAGWIGYLYLRFGDGLAFIHTQAAWPASRLWASLKDWDELIGLTSVLFTAAMLILGWFRLRASYLVYASIHLLLLMNAQRALSVPRYVMVLFPVYMVLAIIGGRSSRFDQLFTILCMGAATVVLIRFGLCYFIG